MSPSEWRRRSSPRISSQRSASGRTRETARAELSFILDQRRRVLPNEYPDLQVRVLRLSRWLVGRVRPALLVLFGAVICVLLIAGADVANLLLARSVVRAGNRRFARRSGPDGCGSYASC